ncbi:MAG TPA: hypothetical protein VGD07_08415 [Methylomirabilota bacterium]
MKRVRLQVTLAFVAVLLLGAQAPAWAQGSDEWSWVVTPQLWGTHIEKNGFAAGSSLSQFIIVNGVGQVLDANPFAGENSQPVETFYPQWGLQVAAQKNRWTLAGSFQYVSFETRSDIVFDFSSPVPPLSPGDRAAQEFIDTQRIDIDFAASYLFPDVVKDRLDLSLGAGVKLIYAEATRQFANVDPFIALFGALVAPGGLYAVCSDDNLTNCRNRDRVKTKDYLYGGTIPMSAIVHLTSDARWLLPLSITPFLGAETRDDRDVVYRLDTPTPTSLEVDRLDGTTFAYGVTADATVRYLLSDTVSVYGGGRVQYIRGHEEYLAYGPIMGMSVRFGGR